MRKKQKNRKIKRKIILRNMREIHKKKYKKNLLKKQLNQVITSKGIKVRTQLHKNNKRKIKEKNIQVM